MKANPESSLYIRTMNPDFEYGSPKFEARVYLMGLVMEKHTSFSHSEASDWVAERVLKGGFDKVTVEVIQETAVGNA